MLILLLVPPSRYTWPSASTYTEPYTCCQIEASCIMIILLFRYINILWQAYTPPPQSLHLMKHNQSIQFAQQCTALICGDHSVCPVLKSLQRATCWVHKCTYHLWWNTRQCEDLTRNMLHADTTTHKKESHITRADTNCTWATMSEIQLLCHWEHTYNMRQIILY